MDVKRVFPRNSTICIELSREMSLTTDHEISDTFKTVLLKVCVRGSATRWQYHC